MRTYEIRLREDLLVPQEQYEKLMNVLTGADIVVSARLDRCACTALRAYMPTSAP